jgi:hypothetical protein
MFLKSVPETACRMGRSSSSKLHGADDDDDARCTAAAAAAAAAFALMASLKWKWPLLNSFELVRAIKKTGSRFLGCVGRRTWFPGLLLA